MTEEKRKILNKINELIEKKKDEMIKQLPLVHDVDDGIIIRFFTKWDNCEDNETIKYKKIPNLDNPNESIVFFFVPKGAFFDLKQHFYIGCITCLNGKIDITANNITRVLENATKICINSDEVQGLAHENTYLITTSDRKMWSKKILEHLQIDEYGK